MISAKLYGLLVGALVLIILKSTDAIKCWDCDSYTNEFCADPFDNRTASISDCSLVADINKQKCRKMIQKINGGLKYTRGCWIDEFNSLQLSEASIELCSTEACNSASNQMPFMLTICLFAVCIGSYFIR